MPKIGEAAPEIDLPTSDGKRFRLADRRGKWVVVYFFPKAFTPGCTKESCNFRDNGPEIRELGAEIVGISTDELKKQTDFAESLSVDFPLAADADGRVSKAWGVLWPVLGVARRATFIVDPQGKIAASYWHELAVAKHLDDVVNFLRRVEHEHVVASGS
jgi:thioredoxin-dependent peroxiredoxin